MLKLIKKINNNILLKNISGTFAIKGASVLVGLLAVPGYISYYQNDGVLGVWYTLIAALNWILTFDFGVGNGLRNNLAKALSNQDVRQGRRLISTAYIVIGMLALAFAIIGEVIIYHIDIKAVLNYTSSDISNDTIRMSLSIIYIGIIIQFWLKLLTSILYAMQKTALNNFLFLLGNIIMLLWVLLARFDDVTTRLLAISVVQVLGINAPLLACSLVLFFGKLKSMAPSIMCFDKRAVKDVVGLGSLFFVIQLSLLVVNSTNEYLITFFYDASSVVGYQIYHKVFFVLITIFGLMIQPIWSGMTVAYNEGRIKWIQKVYNRFNLIGLGGIAVSVALSFFFPLIADVWLGAETAKVVTVQTGLVFSLWVSASLLVNASTCVSNATGHLKVQLVFTVAAAVLKIPLTYAFYKAGLGWEAVVMANALVLVPLLIAQMVANRLLLSEEK